MSSSSTPFFTPPHLSGNLQTKNLKPDEPSAEQTNQNSMPSFVFHAYINTKYAYLDHANEKLKNSIDKCELDLTKKNCTNIFFSNYAELYLTMESIFENVFKLGFRHGDRPVEKACLNLTNRYAIHNQHHRKTWGEVSDAEWEKLRSALKSFELTYLMFTTEYKAKKILEEGGKLYPSQTGQASNIPNTTIHLTENMDQSRLMNPR